MLSHSLTSPTGTSAPPIRYLTAAASPLVIWALAAVLVLVAAAAVSVH
jgi:hypothetical protein